MKRNLWLNKNIRLADLAEASKFMIGPFRSYIKCRKPQNDYFYKTALSRRLLRFHQPGDVVYEQTMVCVFFLSRFINLRGATISLNKLNLMAL